MCQRISSEPMSTDLPLHSEILTVGDELLRGDLADSNAVWLAARLTTLGLPVRRVQTRGDAMDDIAEAIAQSAAEARVLFVTGGLGPTSDDMTAASIAQAAGVPLELDEAVLRRIKARFERAQLPYTANNAKQAQLPRGAQVLHNERGTAPGFRIDIGGCTVFSMPGVPLEMRWMFDTYAQQWIADTLQPQPALRRTIKLFGVGESRVDALLSDLTGQDEGASTPSSEPSAEGGEGSEPAMRVDATPLAAFEPGDCQVSWHYRATFPEVHVMFLVRPGPQSTREQAESLADRLQNAIETRLGDHIFATGETSYPAALVQALAARGQRVAFAESCTGGLAADMVTRVPGSSKVFELGLVAYANRAKEQVLGVPAEVIQREGAVSRACVEAMAERARALGEADYGVGISGILGPEGGSADKPVGTVHFALASAAGTRHLVRRLPFDRQRNKIAAAYVALWMVQSELRGRSGSRDTLDGRWAPEQNAVRSDTTPQADKGQQSSGQREGSA